VELESLGRVLLICLDIVVIQSNNISSSINVSDFSLIVSAPDQFGLSLPSLYNPQAHKASKRTIIARHLELEGLRNLFDTQVPEGWMTGE
jgi:hypothetical protein